MKNLIDYNMRGFLINEQYFVPTMSVSAVYIKGNLHTGLVIVHQCILGELLWRQSHME